MFNRKFQSCILALVGVVIFLLSCGEGNSDAPKELPEKVTFTEHIAPVLYQNCTFCHRPDGYGHFSLVTYAEAKLYGSSIAFAVKERLMPPWPADPDYTQFTGQRILSEYDKQLIAKWVEQGSEEGPKDKMPELPEYEGYSEIGKPDLVLPVAPYRLEAGSVDQFLLVKVPFELPQDTYASVIEFVPGRHNVVHHVNGDMVRYAPGSKADVFAGQQIVDLVTDSANYMQAYQKMGLANDDGTYPELQRSVVNYLPGVFAIKYPENIGGFRLSKKGAFIFNDLHYGFTKDAVIDSSCVNVYFSKVPPGRRVQEFQLGTLGVSAVEPNLVIQPNTVKAVLSRYKVPEAISILTVNPHMHLLGKSFKGYAVTEAGDTIRLISIPRWDFNWQYFYTFKKMVKIPKGATIYAEGVYDNTKQNLNNPFSPPQLVHDQDGSMKATDEMFQFIISYLPYQEGDENISLERK